jgi:diadenosine tetraphosphate (Ap4A) HIT family hydrolase
MRRYLLAVKDADPPFPGTFYVVPTAHTEVKVW